MSEFNIYIYDRPISKYSGILLIFLTGVIIKLSGIKNRSASMRIAVIL